MTTGSARPFKTYSEYWDVLDLLDSYSSIKAYLDIVNEKDEDPEEPEAKAIDIREPAKRLPPTYEYAFQFIPANR